MKKLLYILLFIFCSGIAQQKANAQVNDVGEFLRSGVQGGIDDSKLLLENYLKPYSNGFGANLNSGWNNSARPYKTLGFDIRVNAALSFVPSSDEFFDVAKLKSQFNELELLSESGITPSVAGNQSGRAVVGRKYINPTTHQEEELFSFELPNGTGFSYAPSPMIQATVGIIKDTDVSLRLVPSVSAPGVDANVSLFGIGAKHGLNQWIPGGAVLPVDLSLQFGYTQFNFDVKTNVQPIIDNDTYNQYKNEPSKWDDQEVALESSGYTVNLLVGKNLPILSVFGGVGFQSSTTDIQAKGSYPVTVLNREPQTSPKPKAIEAIEDPLNFSSDGANSVHALAGFRVRFGFFAVSGTYTLSNYPVANVGIGLSFR